MAASASKAAKQLNKIRGSRSRRGRGRDGYHVESNDNMTEEFADSTQPPPPPQLLGLGAGIEVKAQTAVVVVSGGGGTSSQSTTFKCSKPLYPSSISGQAISDSGSSGSSHSSGETEDSDSEHTIHAETEDSDSEYADETDDTEEEDSNSENTDYAETEDSDSEDSEASDVSAVALSPNRPDDLVKLQEEEAYATHIDFEFKRMMIKEEEELTVSSVSGSDLWDMLASDSTLEGMADELRETSTNDTDTPLPSYGEGDYVVLIDLRKHPTVVCRSCENRNGDNLLVRIKSCGCIVCSSCVINSALYSRCWIKGEPGFPGSYYVPCPEWKWPNHSNHSGSLNNQRELCVGVIDKKELEAILSPALFKEITGPLKTERKRERNKIYECTTTGCPGFCKVTGRQTFFRCPICNKTSNCFKCGTKHTEATPCPRILMLMSPPSSPMLPGSSPSLGSPSPDQGQICRPILKARKRIPNKTGKGPASNVKRVKSSRKP